MASSNNFLEGSIIALDRGQWEWSEENGELKFRSNSKSRSSHSRTRPWFPASTQTLQTESAKLSDGETITLKDVKVAAVNLIDKDTVGKAKAQTCKLFDSCFSTEQMNNLLWSTLIYYNSLNEYHKALSDENVSVPGSIGDSARQTLKKCRGGLLQSKINLGEAYSRFILGLGHQESHHCQAGRLRVSKSQTDREFFEVLYEFIMYSVWITFGYKEWEVIHQELGSFFRTPQYNRDFNIKPNRKDPSCIQVEGLGELEKTSDQYITYKVLYERPFVGKLTELHSAAHISYLPEPKDKHSWVFESHSKPPRKERKLFPTTWSPPERLGIIGDARTKYEPDTLRCLEADSDNNASDDGSSSEPESEVSGIIEDDGKSDDLF